MDRQRVRHGARAQDGAADGGARRRSATASGGWSAGAGRCQALIREIGDGRSAKRAALPPFFYTQGEFLFTLGLLYSPAPKKFFLHRLRFTVRALFFLTVAFRACYNVHTAFRSGISPN